MNKYVAGIIAGVVATIALSVLMVLKTMMGMMPDLDVIGMLAGMMGTTRAMGWVAHFVIGAGYGIVFAALFDRFGTDAAVVRAIGLAVAGWLVMMIVLMPMAGAGLFGLNLPSGMMAPIMTLLLHVFFGAVLGASYAGLRRGAAAA